MMIKTDSTIQSMLVMFRNTCYIACNRVYTKKKRVLVRSRFVSRKDRNGNSRKKIKHSPTVFIVRLFKLFTAIDHNVL